MNWNWSALKAVHMPYLLLFIFSLPPIQAVCQDEEGESNFNSVVKRLLSNFYTHHFQTYFTNKLISVYCFLAVCSVDCPPSIMKTSLPRCFAAC